MAREDYGLISERDQKDDVSGVVVRSGFAGVAATILAVALSSPAGLSSMIGVAEGFGLEPHSADANELALPAMPQQLSAEEIVQIQATLAQSNSEMDAMQQATDADIERLRSLAGQEDVLQIRG